jgi:glutamate carboxypeptidase
MNEKLDQILTELNQRYIHVWEDVCNIESPTNHKAGVDAVGTYFINMAKERGWGVEIFEQPVAGNVVTITLNPHVQKAPLSISAHMDTVHPVGSFGTPAVHFADGKIYGPGVTDCKGGAVAAFYAMDVLDRLEFRDRPVCFYLQSDEEGGGKYSGEATIRHICE